MNARLTVASGTATVLASIALYPLLQGGTWFWAGVGAVIVVGAIGALTRRRAIPAVACFAATLAGLFVYLNVMFARHDSWAGLVPTGASVHRLMQLVAQARYETHKFAPAVPNTPGIVLLTAGGIGLVAALTDLLAVRLHRPAIAGLPLLVLFCVPLTTDAQTGAVDGALVFCAGVAGYLGLLSADGRHRLRLWGRLVHPWHNDDTAAPDARPMAAAGRRIGTAAVVLALSLPLLVPGLRQHRLFPGSGGGGGGGGYRGQTSFPNPLDTLNAELRQNKPTTILTYYTADRQPPYLQVYVLDHLGTNAWTMTAPTDLQELRRGNLPAAPGLAATASIIKLREQIVLSRSLRSNPHTNFIPLPYAARQVRIIGTWRADKSSLMLLSSNARLAGLRYTVYSRVPNPTPQKLAAAVPPPGLTDEESVPRAFKTLKKLALRITKHATSEYAKAVALQDWFTTKGGFAYSFTGVPTRDTPGTLRQFLTKSKIGYCQQFAFGMAVLARLLHIPARVVIGYTQGTETKPGSNWWRVETSDAHAWPELYFSGFGWLRFEPTPPNGGAAGQATALSPSYSNPQSAKGGEAGQPTGPAGHRTGTGLNRAHRKGSGGPGGKEKITGGGAGGAGTGRKPGAPVAELAIALLAVLLIAPGSTRLITRRRRWWKARDDAARAHVAWSELRDDLTDHRIPSQASESPRALARRLTRLLSLAGAERAALEQVALAEERASYATSPADSARLRSDVALVRRAMGRALGLRARWLARVAPTSALVPARAGLQHLLDVFGWLELATTKLLGRIVPRRGKPARA